MCHQRRLLCWGKEDIWPGIVLLNKSKGIRYSIPSSILPNLGSKVCISSLLLSEGERNSLSRRGIGSQSFTKRLGNKITPVEVLGLARCTLEPSDHLVSTNPQTKCYLKGVHAVALTSKTGRRVRAKSCP
jgi:hypothetical protein